MLPYGRVLDVDFSPFRSNGEFRRNIQLKITLIGGNGDRSIVSQGLPDFNLVSAEEECLHIRGFAFAETREKLDNY